MSSTQCPPILQKANGFEPTVPREGFGGVVCETVLGLEAIVFAYCY